MLKPHQEHLSSTCLLNLDMAELIPSPSPVFDQAGKVLSHKGFRWQSHSPQQHRAGTASVRAGGGWCMLLHSAVLQRIISDSCCLKAAANKKHKGSIWFLTSGFCCSRWGKFPSQDNLMNKVGDNHPGRASAHSFSICKLYIFCCLQQTEHAYSLLSPYGSTEIRCTVHPDISFENSHSCTEKATCRVSVN